MGFPVSTRSTNDLITAAIWNADVVANFNNSWHLIVRKPSDETVSASVTLQADNDLILPVGTSEVWQFRFCLLIAGSTAGDFSFRFTFPAGGVFASNVALVNASGTFQDLWLGDSSSPTATNSMALNDATIPDYKVIEGVYVASTAGNVVLEWAQNSASGSTTVKANSTLWGVKLA